MSNEDFVLARRGLPLPSAQPTPAFAPWLPPTLRARAQPVPPRAWTPPLADAQPPPQDEGLDDADEDWVRAADAPVLPASPADAPIATVTTRPPVPPAQRLRPPPLHAAPDNAREPPVPLRPPPPQPATASRLPTLAEPAAFEPPARPDVAAATEPGPRAELVALQPLRRGHAPRTSTPPAALPEELGLGTRVAGPEPVHTPARRAEAQAPTARDAIGEALRASPLSQTPPVPITPAAAAPHRQLQQGAAPEPAVKATTKPLPATPRAPTTSSMGLPPQPAQASAPATPSDLQPLLAVAARGAGRSVRIERLEVWVQAAPGSAAAPPRTATPAPAAAAAPAPAARPARAFRNPWASYHAARD